MLIARGTDRLAETAHACMALGAASVVVEPVDVADRQRVDAAIAGAAARHGRVDAVVNSAGVAAYGRFVDVPPDVLERVMATNYLGTANVARAALRQFAHQGGGRLVLVGSLLGTIVTPYMSAYVSSKWAVHGLARILQIEARSTPGVRVTLVSPGGVDTPIYRWSASVLGRQGQPPPPVDPPDKVALAIVRALDKPGRQRSVGLANHLAVLGFRLTPGLFDVLVTPLMDRFGLDPRPHQADDGNAFAPAEDSTRTDYGTHDPPVIRRIRRVVDGAAALASRPHRRHPAAAEHPTTATSKQQPATRTRGDDV